MITELTRKKKRKQEKGKTWKEKLMRIQEI